MDNTINDGNFNNLDIESQIAELTRCNSILSDILDNLPIGLAIFKKEINGKFKTISVNQQLVELGNTLHTYSSRLSSETSDFTWNKSALFAAFDKNICAFAHEDDYEVVLDMLYDSEQSGFSSCRFQLKGTCGSYVRWIESKCLSRRIDPDNIIMYTLFSDVTKQVLWENELENIGSHDSMTGVYNRYQYNKVMTTLKALTLSNTGIVFADINGLKNLNDSFGQATGDQLVKQTAQILIKYFEEKCIYRISGDEFVVIIQNIDAADFDNRVSALLNGLSYYEIASIGHIWNAKVTNIKELISKAEQLMKIQKQIYYSNHLNAASKHRSQTLDTLNDDMLNKRYHIFLQPKADINDNSVIGAEALIRKFDETGKIILPYEFIPLLENELLISKIDFFVLEEICRTINRWNKSGYKPIKISVNMSRVSIAENTFISHILEICDKYNVSHKQIELEITESTNTKDDRKLYEIVNTLHSKGFGISLDDMGNDYSSLSLLQLSGIDTVKLDRSMILKIKEPQGAILIKHIIAMCHELGQMCIAEGVEEAEQQSLLADMHCDYYQGYLLDKPVPIDVFESRHLSHN